MTQGALHVRIVLLQNDIVTLVPHLTNETVLLGNCSIGDDGRLGPRFSFHNLIKMKKLMSKVGSNAVPMFSSAGIAQLGER